MVIVRSADHSGGKQIGAFPLVIGELIINSTLIYLQKELTRGFAECKKLVAINQMRFFVANTHTSICVIMEII